MRWAPDAALKGRITPILVAKPSDEVRKGPYVSPKGPYDHIIADSGRDETMMWAFERPDGGRSFGFTGGHTHAQLGRRESAQGHAERAAVDREGGRAGGRRQGQHHGGGPDEESGSEAAAEVGSRMSAARASSFQSGDTMHLASTAEAGRLDAAAPLSAYTPPPAARPGAPPGRSRRLPSVPARSADGSPGWPWRRSPRRSSRCADLALQQRFGLLRLGERVDPGAAAAPGRLRQLRQRDAGQQPQQRARLARDLLAVHQVTGLVIGDRRRRSNGAAAGARQPVSTSHSWTSRSLRSHWRARSRVAPGRRRAAGRSAAGASRSRRRC